MNIRRCSFPFGFSKGTDFQTGVKNTLSLVAKPVFNIPSSSCFRGQSWFGEMAQDWRPSVASAALSPELKTSRTTGHSQPDQLNQAWWRDWKTGLVQPTNWLGCSSRTPGVLSAWEQYLEESLALPMEAWGKGKETGRKDEVQGLPAGTMWAALKQGSPSSPLPHPHHATVCSRLLQTAALGRPQGQESHNNACTSSSVGLADWRGREEQAFGRACEEPDFLMHSINACITWGSPETQNQ